MKKTLLRLFLIVVLLCACGLKPLVAGVTTIPKPNCNPDTCTGPIAPSRL